MAQNVDELAGDGYFVMYMPESLQRLRWRSGRKQLVDWLMENMVPIFSDMKAGNGEFDCLEDRNRKLLVKWVEFARLSGEEPYWVFPNRSGSDYPDVYEVEELTDSVERLSAYYCRRFADVVGEQVRLTLGFGKYAIPIRFGCLREEYRERMCREAVGRLWPEWLDFENMSEHEPDLQRLSPRKRLCWSIMCFMATVGVIGEALQSESLSSFARRVVDLYAEVLLLKEDA
ncbi:hypothetical protein MAJ_11079, partial [Metarhizium majus ARSEF 297]